MKIISKISNESIAIFLMKIDAEKYEVTRKKEGHRETTEHLSLIEALNIFNEYSQRLFPDF